MARRAVERDGAVSKPGDIMTSHDASHVSWASRQTPQRTRERFEEIDKHAATRPEASVGISLVLRSDAPHFTVLAVSDACGAALNRKPADMVGAPFIQLFFDSKIAARPEQLETLLTAFRRVMHGHDLEATCLQHLEFTHRHGAASDRPCWMNVRISPVLAADRSVCYLLVQLESAVAETQPATADASDPWLPLLAREMLQPLGTIASHADRLAKENFAADNEPVMKMYVEHIRRASHFLTGMLEDVLDTACVDSGKLTLSCRALDLASTVWEVVDQLPAISGRCNLETERGLETRVWGDVHRIRQALTNLLTSVGVLSEPLSPIKIHVGRLETSLVVSLACRCVCSQGEVIAMLDRTRRVPLSDLPPSLTGVGFSLIVARGIVEAHGGSIWADETPSRDMRFHFTLPKPAIAEPPRRSPSFEQNHAMA